MSLFNELAKIDAAIAALPGATPPDLSSLATAAEVAALSAKIDALASAVGNPPAPPAAP